MGPPIIEVSPAAVGGQGTAPRIETGRQSQTFLEPAPSYEKTPEFHMLPTWSEKILDGLKKTSLIAGCVVCGALAVALFPLTIVGEFLRIRGQSYLNPAPLITEEEKAKGDRLKMAGTVLAAPAEGMLACVRELRKPSEPIEPSERWSALTKFVDKRITALAHKTQTFIPQKLEKEEAKILKEFETRFKKMSKDELLQVQEYVKDRWDNPFDPGQSAEKVKKFHAIFEKYLQNRYGTT
jgi:hypothetical protein